MNVQVPLPKRQQRRPWLHVMILGLVAACSVGILPEPGFAQQSSSAPSRPVTRNDASPSGVGIQAGSALATIMYFPLKLTYAIGGGVVGGLGLRFLWRQSTNGEKYLDSQHVRNLYHHAGPPDRQQTDSVSGRPPRIDTRDSGVRASGTSAASLRPDSLTRHTRVGAAADFTAGITRRVASAYR